MKKKVLMLIVTTVALAISLCVLAACDGKDGGVGEISFASGSGGSIDGDKMSLEVGTTVENADLNYILRVGKGTTFTVSEDEDGKLVVPDKIVKLSRGDNKFYVTVKKGSRKKVFELNIWKNFKTTIYYYVNGELFDKQDDVLSHTYLEDFRAPDNLEYGMQFLGWDCEGYYVEEQGKVFNAKLKYKEVVVDLNADGGACSAQKAILYVGAGYALPVPQKNGYTFNGWTYNGRYVTDGKGESNGRWVLDKSVEFKAEWRPDTYNVYFTSNLKDVGREYKKECRFGKTYTVGYEVKKPGYRFLGWYKDGEKISGDAKLTFTAESDMSIEMRFEYDVALDNLDYIYNYDGLKITGVKDKSVTSLTIPCGVDKIEEGILADCKNLQELVLPFVGIARRYAYTTDNLFGILFGRQEKDGYIKVRQAYEHTSYFTYYSYYIPASLKKVTVLGGGLAEGAFENCSMLTEIVIDTDSETVGSYAFAGCTALEKVALNRVKNIGANAFKDCASLTDIAMLNDVEYVGKDAFANTAWFDAQKDGAVYVGKALYKYKGTAADGERITVKNSTVSISEEAFYGCCADGKNITVYIPTGVATVGKNAFGGSGETAIACAEKVKPNDWDGDWRDTDTTSVAWDEGEPEAV